MFACILGHQNETTLQELQTSAVGKQRRQTVQLSSMCLRLQTFVFFQKAKQWRPISTVFGLLFELGCRPPRAHPG